MYCHVCKHSTLNMAPHGFYKKCFDYEEKEKFQNMLIKCTD